MSENPYSSSSWPPPPASVPEPERSAALPRLLTGAAWSDAFCAFLLSGVSFALLTFALANPVAASLILHFPALDRYFSTGERLLIGWTFALVVQFAAWNLSRKHHFRVLADSLPRTGFSMAPSWLIIIVVAWWLFE